MGRFPPLNEQMDCISKGVVEILPEDELEKKIVNSTRSLDSAAFLLYFLYQFDPSFHDEASKHEFSAENNNL